MTEPYLSDRFVVLGRRPFRDNDAHLVLLGEQLGKCVALAKGVGKPTSKLSSLLEVGNLIEAELYVRWRVSAVGLLPTKRSAQV